MRRLFVLTALLFALPAHAFLITQITNNNYDDYYPAISGSNVVWYGNPDWSDNEIYLWNGSTITQITDNDTHDTWPDVSGSNVVWAGCDAGTGGGCTGGGDLEIYLWDGSTTTQITDNSYHDRAPAISGSNVAWDGQYGVSDTEIYFWDGSTTTQITDNSYTDYYPDISGSNVVWMGNPSGSDIGSAFEIFLWDGSTTMQITNNSYADWNPAISGSNVVWQRYDGSDFEIFLWDGSTTTQITNNNWDDEKPAISGSNVVWYRRGVGFHLWDGSDITQITDSGTTPDISGLNVVWSARGCCDYEIYMGTIEFVECRDGIDNDADGFIDWDGGGVGSSDPGCANAVDPSERSLLLVCDDGDDNDGDTLIDYPADPGCFHPASNIENPQCQDGIHNDLGQDWLIDFDGGVSAGVPPEGQTDPDPQCTYAWQNQEAWRRSYYRCGLGVELALLLPPLMWLWRRR